MPLFGFSRKPPSTRPGQFQKLISKKPVAPPPKSKGLFGEKSYRTFTNLREFARKAPYERIPGYDKRLGKTERVGLMDTLRKYSGESYGISEQKLGQALKKMQKEKMYTKDYAKKKELDQKIKMLEKWRQGN